MRLGERAANGDVFVRCWECGDSRDQSHAHCAVKETGFWFCYRCRSHGTLPLANVVEIFLGAGASVPRREIAEPGDRVYGGRESWLEKYDHELGEAFEIRDPDGGHAGWYVRLPEKGSLIDGRGGFGFNGALVSSPRDPLVIVEGPYDCLDDRDVCTYGVISKSVERLATHSVVLCPDGDVWTDRRMREQFLRTLRHLCLSQWVDVVGVQVLPDGLDPDEVPKRERRFVPRAAFRKVFSGADSDRGAGRMRQEFSVAFGG